MSNYYCQLADVLALMPEWADFLTDSMKTKITSYLIPNAEDEIDNYCGYPLRETEERIFVDGSGTRELVLPFRFITELIDCRVWEGYDAFLFQSLRWRMKNTKYKTTEFAAFGGPEPKDGKTPPYQPGDYDWKTTLENVDLLVDCNSGILTIPPGVAIDASVNADVIFDFTFPEGNENVEVWCKAGFPAGKIPNDLRVACALLAKTSVLQEKSMKDFGGVSSVTIGKYSKSAGREGRAFGADMESDRKNAFRILDDFKLANV